MPPFGRVRNPSGITSLHARGYERGNTDIYMKIHDTMHILFVNFPVYLEYEKRYIIIKMKKKTFQSLKSIATVHWSVLK